MAGRRRSSTSPANTGPERSHTPRWAAGAAVLGALATLVAALGGLYFNAQATRQATVGQTSERFSRSLDQLASQDRAVRTGAIYAFGGLMRDSPDDRQAIVEILSSYIKDKGHELPKPGQNQHYAEPPADLLAAIKVLDQQPQPRVHVAADGTRTTWPSMHLQGVELFHLALSGVSMRQADLRYSMLAISDLDGADLSGSNLEGATLGDAVLADARLTGANLRGADLFRTHLVQAHLSGADLRGASLLRANLRAADLSGADLRQADLSAADLRGATLQGTKLAGVICSPKTKWPAELQTIPAC